MIPSLDKTIRIVSQQESRDSNIFGRIPQESSVGHGGRHHELFPQLHIGAQTFFLAAVQFSSSRQCFEILS